MPVTQTERLIKFKSTLGEDELLLERFSGREAVSGLFEFEVDLLSNNPSISFSDIVGEPATISIANDFGGRRHINGCLSHFAQGSQEAGFVRYHAVLVPWLWNLTRTADSRIFQEKSVPDIIEQIFDDLGFDDFRMQLTGQYDPRVYCVQYQETDFAFVSRLMEEEGIFYFFEHSSDKHILVLMDSSAGVDACPDQSKVPYAPMGGPQTGDAVTEWLYRMEIRTARYAARDYNFETPSLDLSVEVPTIMQEGRNDDLEVYEYPGQYGKRGEGERYAKLRMEEQETPHTRISGNGDCCSLIPGYSFDLTDHFRPDFNAGYFLTSVEHSGGSNVIEGRSHPYYANSFQCIPKEVPYRTSRKTPKPIVHGAQTAMVVGPKGEEIYTDKYGRVKVQFHWDREGKRDDKSSCWIRVSQLWAGSEWGGIHIPRIGQEVIVAFLEGDPDRPIIVGRAYNAERMPPYALPNHQTRSGLKSRSSKQGGGSNFNEIRFEDKKGEEKIFINAEKDIHIRVEKECREYAGTDRHLTVEGNQKEIVEKDKHLHVKKDHMEKIDNEMSLEVGMKRNEKTGMVYAHEVGQEIHLKAGMKIVIESGLQLSLVGAGGFIDIGPAGISIQGTAVNINSGGAPGVGSGSMPKEPSDPEIPDDGMD